MGVDPFLGRTLSGRFRVTGFIGEGAMANVYRAVQEAEPQDVALKILHPHLVKDRTFVARFRREARAAATIRHPNTVSVVDMGVDEGAFFIAMELLTGRDLFELLVLEKRLPEQRAARILIQICRALAAAHERGIVHRDLKPENVMLIDDPARPGEDVVKVLDFGIAKILEKEGDDDAPQSSSMGLALTSFGVVLGTPAYMSPEQCRGGVVDARSDIYSAGVLLYQLVTGRLPFLGEKHFEISVQHVRDAPPRPSSLVEGLHPGLEGVILRALEKRPEGRQQSAHELELALEALEPALGEAPLRVRAPMLIAPRASSDGELDRLSTLDAAPTSLRVTRPTRDPEAAPTLPRAPKAPPLPAPVEEAATHVRPSRELIQGGVAALAPPSSRVTPAMEARATWIAIALLVALGVLGVLLAR